MSREKLVRWGGPAAIMGGLAYVAVALLTVAIYFYEILRGPVFEAHAFIHAFDAPMYLLLTVGLTGLYLRQRDRFGKAGKAGFFLAFAGFGLGFLASVAVIVVGLTVGDEATLGVLDALAHPLPMLLYTVGSLLFGLATYRAGMLPRLPAVMVAVAPGLLFAMMTVGLVGPDRSAVPLLVFWAATGLGWTWLGRSALSAREQAQGGPDVGGEIGAEPAVR